MSVLHKSKKFNGFTSIFKNANTQKKDTEPENQNIVQKPFAGFTPAYKNIKLQKEHDEEENSHISQTEINEDHEIKLESLKHFIPMRYNLWYEKRITTAEARRGNNNEKKKENKDEDTNKSLLDNMESIYPNNYKNVTPFATDLHRKYTYEGNKFYSKNNAHIYSSEYPKGHTNKSLQNISVLNKVEKYRNLKYYPQKYHLKILNNRIKQFLNLLKYCDRDEVFSRSGSDFSFEDYYMVQTNQDFSPIIRKKLIKYFKKNISSCGNKEIDFRSENFDSWYSRFSFNFERKYKKYLKLPENIGTKDFSMWFQDISEKIEQEQDEPFHISKNKHTISFPSCNDTKSHSRNTMIQSENLEKLLMEEWNPSLSHCESCRDF
ncbi:hypothetical protein PGB90_005428 [Kerria lacca]